MTDLSAQRPVRELSPDEIEQMLALHRLYLETEYHEGHRANFSSTDLTGRDFSGLNLRGIKMDRAVLRGADLTGARLQSANLIGAMLQEARFDKAHSSRARLSGANFVSRASKTLASPKPRWSSRCDIPVPQCCRTRFARLAAAANEVGLAISVRLGVRIGSSKAEQGPLILPGQWQT